MAALALGLAAFFVLIGWQTLLPTNIGWLDFGDRAMHQLGWMFYRQAPWGVPPGLSPRLGIELANSIALVDGLPLFALPLKLFAQWLPQPVQYWGVWLLLSFVLQALFAYGIARQLQAGRLISLLAAGFALITPAFMFRVEMHLALSGHWTILAALYLYVRRDAPRPWMWPLLLGLTAAIHAYLLGMALAIWLAALVERLWSRRIRWSAALVEIAAAIALMLAVLWLVGFFDTGTAGTYGYGDYKLNLLWPLLTYRGWSQLIPDLPHTKYDYEGLSFLGIGILALLAIGLVTGAFAQLRAAVHRRWLPLVVMLLAMMLFAVTRNVHFADTQLAVIPLPRPVIDLFSIFRSTGRFVWPLLYLLTIGAAVMVGRRLPALVAVPIVLVAFAAQAWDSGPALLNFNRHLPSVSAIWETPLKSEVWARAAAAGYDRVRAIPVVSNPGTDWKALGYYAVTHRIAVDSVYLGRVDGVALAALRAREQHALETGEFEPHTLYILDQKSAALAAAHVTSADLLAIVDKRIVFARNGAHLLDGLTIAPYIQASR